MSMSSTDISTVDKARRVISDKTTGYIRVRVIPQKPRIVAEGTTLEGDSISWSTDLSRT